MNNIIAAGTVWGIEKSHEQYGEKFFKFLLSVSRTSGEIDVIPCVAPELIINEIAEGGKIEISGNVRTRNVLTDGKSKLDIYVFVSEISEYKKDKNMVEIDGCICKKPLYRKTPKGRQVADVLIASSRITRRSDYIPSIAWGRNALRVKEWDVSDKIHAKARFQSREYKKTIDEKQHIKIAYELSISSIEKIKESEE